MTGRELRKDFVDYYKWNVNLATFVLTVSLSVLAFSSKTNTVVGKGWLYIGWSLLGICIFSNWMIVKSLINMNTMEAVANSGEELDENSSALLVQIAKGIYDRSKAYALIQHTSFLFGILFTVIGLFLNLK